MANNSNIPEHIAVILDGNRRWAKQRGLSPLEGHRAGYEATKRVADVAFARGVKQLTGYAFSTENWSRTSEEVDYLMKLIGWVMSHEAKEFHRKGIRIRVLGFEDKMKPSLVKSFRAIEELTKDNQAGTLNICFNYGGRGDIVAAAKQLVRDGVAPDDIDAEAFASRLLTAGLPDPDLIIRTSGEQRLSNFLPWEGAYSELYFTDTLWPDFDEAAFDLALAEYARRNRRFGA